MTYVRAHHPPRRRRDRERWTYTELDAAGSPVRHIEMRGTYVAAAARAEVSAAHAFGGDEAVAEYEARYGKLPEEPIVVHSEMTADGFAELWRLARCRLDGVAEIQIHEVRPPTPEGIPVVVRCVGGLVRVGTRFDHVRETGEQMRLSVAWIERYVELEPPYSAILILSGSAGTALRPGVCLIGHTA